MNILYIDTETYSPIPIARGLFKYLEKVELLIVTYAYNNGAVKAWDVTSEAMPEDLGSFLRTEWLTYCAHNSQFDRLVLQKTIGLHHDEWQDTNVSASRHSLPGSLQELCSIFKIPEDIAKLKTGRALIHLFCKPLGKNRKLNRATKETHPKQWAQFIDYAKSDISAMRVLHATIPNWNDTEYERKVWQLDQKINALGFQVDIDLAEKAISTLEGEKARNDKETRTLTGDQIRTTNQRDKLLKFVLSEYDVLLPDMQASTLKRRIDDPSLPQPVKDLLLLRLASAKTSTRKYQTLLNGTNIDGRLRGTLSYCGASRTGRWSGRLFQPQNLPRPTFGQEDIDTGVFAIKNECVPLFFDSSTEICSSAIRSLIIPKKDHKLVVSDYSSIEGRVLAWISGEQWKLEAYKDFDSGAGHDMYTVTYANTFEIDPATVDKKQRQLGKVLELALGYGGGVGAFITFAKAFNLDLNELTSIVLPSYIREQAEKYYHYHSTESENPLTSSVSESVFIACDGIKRMWRENSFATVALWKDVEQSVRSAAVRGLSNTNTFRNGLVIDRQGSWVRIHLPSGRFLCYPGMSVEESTDLTYAGKDQYSRKWCRLKTYGGKLVENIVQAIARDVLVNGMFEAEKAGYTIVLTIHDELVTEVLDIKRFSHQHLSDVIAQSAPWMTGLPLKAEGYESYRYKK